MAARTWTPEQRAKVAATNAQRQAARIEDIEDLLRWDNNAQSVVTRAGFPSVSAAERFLARMGRHDLASKLSIYGHNQDVYHHYYGAEAFGVAS